MTSETNLWPKSQSARDILFQIDDVSEITEIRVLRGAGPKLSSFGMSERVLTIGCFLALDH